jgi:hypothetical protein
MKKEKFIQEIRIVVPPSLRSAFKKKCENKYKTISEVLRELMVGYVNGKAE